MDWRVFDRRVFREVCHNRSSREKGKAKNIEKQLIIGISVCLNEEGSKKYAITACPVKKSNDKKTHEEANHD